MLRVAKMFIEEKEQAVAIKFKSACESSKDIWQDLEPRVCQYSELYFKAIVEHLNGDLICSAGKVIKHVQ